MTPATQPDETTLRQRLQRVIDPEAGLNIIDLGLVYRLDIAPSRVRVEMTMTSPACPLGDMITDEVKEVLRGALPAACAVEVKLVWEPPWQPAMMSEAGRRHFGWKDGDDA